MSNKALALYLESPMQSWGVTSRFQRRDTESYPSKSGVLGLIAGALGIDKNSPEEAAEIAKLAALNFSVFQINKNSRNRAQRLTDYHTVGGGYDKNDPMGRMSICSKAGNGLPSDNAVLTQRTYLADARFIVVLEGNADVLGQCQKAIIDPVWGIWLGRKCCIPSTPLIPTLAENAEDALAQIIATLHANTKHTFALAADQGQREESGDGAWYPPDQPISYKSRTYKTRPVKRVFR